MDRRSRKHRRKIGRFFLRWMWPAMIVCLTTLFTLNILTHHIYQPLWLGLSSSEFPGADGCFDTSSSWHLHNDSLSHVRSSFIRSLSKGLTANIAPSPPPPLRKAAFGEITQCEKKTSSVTQTFLTSLRGLHFCCQFSLFFKYVHTLAVGHFALLSPSV